LLEAGRRDLERVIARLEESLEGAEFLCGGLSIADLALFPHLSSLKLLGIPLDGFPGVLRWNRSMRTLPCVQQDLEHVKRSVVEKFASGTSPYEGERVVWRGDRVEWLIAHGYWDWFRSELVSGRAVVPRSI
jgi:hypothetical protein